VENVIFSVKSCGKLTKIRWKTAIFDHRSTLKKWGKKRGFQQHCGKKSGEKTGVNGTCF
jgi:hypothetical protein